MNRRNSILLVLVLMNSCIEAYNPDLNESHKLLVINGSITDQPGEQFIEVSHSAPFYDPKFFPVSGCVIHVEDNFGTIVTYSESKPGIYKAFLDGSFLGLNKTYRLHLYSPDGKEYLSDFDSLLSCPPLDSVFYKYEVQETENSILKYQGLRFLLDLKGSPTDSRNFLWKLEETFEYKSWYPIQFIWDGANLSYGTNATDSLFTCFITAPISKYYSSSTKYLAANELNNFSLNYVSNATNRLRVKYSLLVKQFSLSDRAYEYWGNMTRQLNDAGGLYEKQPPIVNGNIFNANDDKENVLGYFYASQVKEKRIFVVDTLLFQFAPTYCLLDTAYSLEDITGKSFYLISFGEEEGPPYGYGKQCFDCRVFGGTVTPPTFWDDDE